MATPITQTICRIVAQPCDVPVCDPTGATVRTDAPVAVGAGAEQQVDFDDVVVVTAPTTVDGDENIVIGADGVYNLILSIDYSAAADGPATARIKVNGISDPGLTFVHQVSGVVPTNQTVQANVALNTDDVLTVTVETSVSELTIEAGFSANKICGTTTDVIVPQG